MFSLIVAVDKNNGIGYQGNIPWNYPEDLKYFKKITSEVKNPEKRNVIIMGRKTHDSIGKDLPGRINLIMSRTGLDLKQVLEYVKREKKKIETCFVIGGAEIYRLFLENNLVNGIYLTRIPGEHKCDVFFPDISEKYKLIDSEIRDGLRYEYLKFQNQDEIEYLKFVKNILYNGETKEDRTGTGTLSLVSPGELRFNLEYYPLLTTKFCSFRIIAKELLWFLSGSTDNKVLQKQNIHIWDGNSSKEFIKSRGLDYEEGDIGPGYGFNWRHFGETYQDCHTEYKGFDQIKMIIELIKTDPYSRRIILNAWDPSKLSQMCLPPCHLLAQFFITQKKYLSCKLYMRSSDTFLGLPYNISSYALLTKMIAEITGLESKELIIGFGDAHIYLNHVEVIKEQIERVPKIFPKLRFKRKVMDIDDFSFEDFELINYYPDGSLRAKMAV